MNNKNIYILILGISILVFQGNAMEKPEKDEIPSIIMSPSCVGEVEFPHELHYSDMEFECTDCHHEINAAKLKIPHEDYFDDFWIDCQICHHETGITLAAQSCSNCHHNSPTSIADETLSAKVVIHKNCWECHEVETGTAASQSCPLCHTGPKTEH